MAEPSEALAAILDACEAVFARAPVEFQRLVVDLDAVVYQADPLKFARAYPSSNVKAAYESCWPPLDLDFWVEIKRADSQVRVLAEGTVQPEAFYDLGDDLPSLARTIADHFERLLSS